MARNAELNGDLVLLISYSRLQGPFTETLVPSFFLVPRNDLRGIFTTTDLLLRVAGMTNLSGRLDTHNLLFKVARNANCHCFKFYSIE